ncbi:DivIVA domain-containing protein [Lactobacillus xylocopicola]|uniref:Cell division protein DivIVA n=1 Tax=Lactobacillus xylocopicola TaxID=2976676 RepID=A0ABM8BGL4_9LACO|nr:DivIVA domain-containing protein [Lactobacillus xylocopicola]BDR60405.1 cell division protein DivIVA [Lactobacillus xylocopicola]
MANKKTQVKRLTPIEIHKKEFKKRGLSGYDRREVDGFLDHIVDDYGSILDENTDLKNELYQIKSELNDYKKQAITLQQTDQTVKDTIAKAQLRAQDILNEAAIRANNVTAQAKADTDYQQQQLEGLRADYDRVKREVAGYRNNLKEMLQEIMDNLDDERWQKALDKYFGTERFYPSDGGEPVFMADGDADAEEDDDDSGIEFDNDEDNEVNFGEDTAEDDEGPRPIDGDSPNLEMNNLQTDVSVTNNSGPTIVFPEDYKNHS